MRRTRIIWETKMIVRLTFRSGCLVSFYCNCTSSGRSTNNTHIPEHSKQELYYATPAAFGFSLSSGSMVSLGAQVTLHQVTNGPGDCPEGLSSATA